jgi:hypothetical protein
MGTKSKDAITRTDDFFNMFGSPSKNNLPNSKPFQGSKKGLRSISEWHGEEWN